MQSGTEVVHLTYHHWHETDIHEFIFHKASRQAIDQCFGHIDHIYRQVTPTSIVRVLIDYRESGYPPAAYSLSKGRQFLKTLNVHPEARFALVTYPSALSSMFLSIFSQMRLGHLKTHVFNGDHRDAAMEWLLKP